MKISFVVAVDFTASNGEGNNPSSLHYIHPDGVTLNQYATAISSIGSVIEFYDTDKKYALYGFGGKPYPGNPANHCFPLNNNEIHPEVDGVHGILDTYYKSVRNVQLSGPTLFSGIIGQAAAIAASTPQDHNNQKYFVLTIITDGIINDMATTIDSIVRASGLPLSIIIIGVGDADFTDMSLLDGDKVPLKSSTGAKQARDIVQFCAMNEFKGLQGEAYRSAVAQKVLEELPRQLTQYYKAVKIAPNHHTGQPLPPPPAYSAY